MTVIYITEYNCRCYAVSFQNNGFVQVQKIEDVSEDDKNIIYSINPMEVFLGKTKSDHGVNTILLKVGIENGQNRYIYIGGDKMVSFLTSDNIYEYISIMGNNLTPYSFAVGMENYYLLTPNFSFIKKDKIDYETMLNKIYVSESDLPFQNLELTKIHSNYNYDNESDDDN